MKTQNKLTALFCLTVAALIFYSCNKPAPVAEATSAKPSTDRINTWHQTP